MTRHPSSIAIADYTYDLPQEKIAEYPLANRDDAKLLVYKNGNISDSVFKNITDFLPEKSILIFNNTRVVQARLYFKSIKEQKLEIFCLEPERADIDITQAMLVTKKIMWKCLVGNLKKWRDEILVVNINEVSLSAKLIKKNSEDVSIEFNWEPSNLCFAEVLEKIGEMPIPPYLKRKSDDSDSLRYQTIYATQKGSVAAPTAGLHFTPTVTEKLKIKNHPSLFVTLHVGAGTFKPVKSQTLANHDMHAEWISISKETIVELLKNKNTNKIAVGTTSLRTLESLYWMGLKIVYKNDIDINELEIKQWEPYSLKEKEVPLEKSLEALMNWLERNHLNNITCKTQILLAPPYQLKLVDGIITNFHQPQSTLLLLISCIVGNDWRKIYDYALENKFRFLSYGDSSLLLK